MAKLCHKNGLINKLGIVPYIHLSMECLLRYIITSQAEAECSAEKGGEQQQQQQLQIKKEGNVEQHDLNNYHTMTASSSSSRATATTTNTAMGKNTRESIARTTPPLPPSIPPLFNLHDYFQPPVFDQLDELNKC
jgi:hypothetical protein